jgi:hypothetical protein
VDAADVPLQRLVLSVVNLSLAVEGWSDKIDWHLSFAGEEVHSRGDGSRQLPSEQLRQRVLRRGGSIESILGLLTESLYKSEHRQRVVAASLQQSNFLTRLAKYAIRLPANRVLQDRIGYLLGRPVGRP